LDAQSVLIQLLVAAIPAVLLYFTGWSYLYFYLNAFHVNITEIGFDLPTVFIYAYPPLYAFATDHWVILIVVALLILAVLFFLRCTSNTVQENWRGLVATRPISWLVCLQKKIVDAKISSFFPPSRAFKLFIMLAIIIFILPFPLTSLTRWAALREAARKWDGHAPQLVPVIDDHSPPPLLALFRRPDKTETSAELQKTRIDACEQRGELFLIFSSEAHYYLLCRAPDVPSVGTLFEVSGKEGLMSVRHVQKGSS
jgi:hypothetical protein